MIGNWWKGLQGQRSKVKVICVSNVWLLWRRRHTFCGGVEAHLFSFCLLMPSCNFSLVRCRALGICETEGGRTKLMINWTHIKLLVSNSGANETHDIRSYLSEYIRVWPTRHLRVSLCIYNVSSSSLGVIKHRRVCVASAHAYIEHS